MIRFDAEAALFSVKCFIAAMLAYYVALRIGLVRPYWAVTTSYIVAQPLAGAVLSKAAFRLVGTLVGAAAAVALVPTFVNEPAVLSLALALWLGFCLYVSLLDRTPRAYMFLLAGYTASIIGFPAVDVPGTVFNIAIVRVQEISIGIAAGSLIHGVVFPRNVADRLLARVDAILADGERWSRASLAGLREEALDRERRRLAIDLADLHQLSIHLPFDTARILPRVRTVRALQDQLSLLLPLASTIEDRLAELTACPEGIPAEVSALVERIEAWLADGVVRPDRSLTAQPLIDEANALEPVVGETGIVWRDMLLLNLLSRLADLVATHRDARDLRDQLRAPTGRPVTERVGYLVDHSSDRPLHRDPGLALRAAFGAIATIGIGSTFWIATAWPAGAGAVLISGVCCALFANFDDPGPIIFKFLVGSAIGLACSTFYAFVLMPRATDFVTLAALLAPCLLVIGSMLARPPMMLIAAGMALGFPNTVGLNAIYDDDFAGFVNGAMAQLIGTGFAVITVGLFQAIGIRHSVARLARAGWRDVARRARGKDPDLQQWMSRMLDRVGLLVPRLAAQEKDPGKPLLDALIDLRIGLVAGELKRLGGAATEEQRRLLDTTLDGVDRHFRTLTPDRHWHPEPALLTSLDRSVAAFAADADEARRRDGLILLTSLRRNLFPQAQAYGATA